MPERQSPVMRAATTGERLSDWIEQLKRSIGEQPLAQVAQVVPDLQAQVPRLPESESERQFYEGMDPGTEQMARGIMDGGLMGGGVVGAVRKVPKMGGTSLGRYPGQRIPKGGQNSLDQLAKIPRFRSESGTYLKRDKEWWRLVEQPADSLNITLERFNPETGQMMRRTMSVDDYVSGVFRDKTGRADPGAPKRRSTKR